MTTDGPTDEPRPIIGVLPLETVISSRQIRSLRSGALAEVEGTLTECVEVNWGGWFVHGEDPTPGWRQKYGPKADTPWFPPATGTTHEEHRHRAAAVYRELALRALGGEPLGVYMAARELVEEQAESGDPLATDDAIRDLGQTLARMFDAERRRGLYGAGLWELPPREIVPENLPRGLGPSTDREEAVSTWATRTEPAADGGKAVLWMTERAAQHLEELGAPWRAAAAHLRETERKRRADYLARYGPNPTAPELAESFSYGPPDGLLVAGWGPGPGDDHPNAAKILAAYAWQGEVRPRLEAAARNIHSPALALPLLEHLDRIARPMVFDGTTSRGVTVKASDLGRAELVMPEAAVDALERLQRAASAPNLARLVDALARLFSHDALDRFLRGEADIRAASWRGGAKGLADALNSRFGYRVTRSDRALIPQAVDLLHTSRPGGRAFLAELYRDRVDSLDRRVPVWKVVYGTLVVPHGVFDGLKRHERHLIPVLPPPDLRFTRANKIKWRFPRLQWEILRELRRRLPEYVDGGVPLDTAALAGCVSLQESHVKDAIEHWTEAETAWLQPGERGVVLREPAAHRLYMDAWACQEEKRKHRGRRSHR